MDVGGLGFYSHGDQSLTHHHWVRQVISAGCFSVHCTETAESALKGVFRHALSRVRHAEQNVTHASMSNYLCHDLLYRALTPTFIPPKPVQRKTARAQAHAQTYAQSHTQAYAQAHAQAQAQAHTVMLIKAHASCS